MPKKFFTLVFFFCIPVWACAQIVVQEQRGAKYSTFIEFAGSAGFYSVNAERLNSNNWVFRAGISYLPEIAFVLDDPTFIFPFSYSYLIKSGRSTYLELGGGVSSFVAFGENPGKAGIPIVNGIIGLRGQDVLGESTFYRLTFLPSYVTVGDKGIYPWGGLSIGYTF